MLEREEFRRMTRDVFADKLGGSFYEMTLYSPHVGTIETLRIPVGRMAPIAHAIKDQGLEIVDAVLIEV